MQKQVEDVRPDDVITKSVSVSQVSITETQVFISYHEGGQDSYLRGASIEVDSSAEIAAAAEVAS